MKVKAGVRIGLSSETDKLCFERFFAVKGYSQQNIQYIYAPLDELIPELSFGRIDLAILKEPEFTILSTRYRLATLQNSPLAFYVTDPCPVSASLLKTNSDERMVERVSLIVQRMDRAIDSMRTNRGYVNFLLTKYLKIDSTVANDIGLYKWNKSNEIDATSIHKLEEIFRNRGILN
jgi:hypothetical protein